MVQPDKANRIFIALTELIDVTEKTSQSHTVMYLEPQLQSRLKKLLASSDYKEMKEWLKGKS